MFGADSKQVLNIKCFKNAQKVCILNVGLFFEDAVDINNTNAPQCNAQKKFTWEMVQNNVYIVYN